VPQCYPNALCKLIWLRLNSYMVKSRGLATYLFHTSSLRFQLKQRNFTEFIVSCCQGTVPVAIIRQFIGAVTSIHNSVTQRLEVNALKRRFNCHEAIPFTELLTDSSVFISRVHCMLEDRAVTQRFFLKLKGSSNPNICTHNRVSCSC
jgi:hypothetical protein